MNTADIDDERRRRRHRAGVWQSDDFWWARFRCAGSRTRTQVRRNGIVMWLTWTTTIQVCDRLIALKREGQLPYDVRAFRGSYLQLLSLEGLALPCRETAARYPSARPQ